MTDRVAPVLAVDLADVERAAVAIEGQVVRTPTLRSRTLSAITGADVWLKFENLQFTSSFKERGALYRLLQLSPQERHAGVIAVSAGNHAQGVAYHATRLGIHATIVMPRSTPNVKIASTESLGATIVLHGNNLAEPEASAREITEREGSLWIAPFDDPYIIAGQGTVALELLADAEPLDVIIVPVGGGGLIAGIAVAAHGLASHIEVIGVQSDLYPSMLKATRGDLGIPGGVTIAEGIAVSTAGTLTAPIVERFVSDLVTVPESEIEQAVGLLIEIEKTVVEGAGAAPLAAMLADPARFKGRRVGLVVSGGNIDPRVLASVIMRGLVRSGRLSRLSITVSDAPGELARVAAIVGAADANIIEVAHQRLFADLSIKNTVLDIAIETRDREHGVRTIAALEAAGYRVTHSPM